MENTQLGETTPLLAAEGTERQIAHGKDTSLFATFQSNDPADPRKWPSSLKWTIMVIMSSTAFMCSFNCMSVVPFANTIIDDLDGRRRQGDTFASVLPVTIWELGEAAGPLLIAPLSEIFGRYPVINVCNAIFITGTILAALSNGMPFFITTRALTGMAVTSNVLNSAITGDIFASDQQGTALSLNTFSPIIGGTVGPALGGWIAERWGWRAVLWVAVALAVACALVCCVFLKETYAPTILRRRAAKLREDVKKAPSYGATSNDPELKHDSLWTSMTRPAAVLWSSGVLTSLSIFASIVFAHLYVVTVSLPSILEDLYGLSQAATGSAFLANGLGSFLGVLICNFTIDKIYAKLTKANEGKHLPENRLPVTVVAAYMLPPVIVLYGLCAEFKLPLAVLLFCVVWIRMCIVLALLPMVSYIIQVSGLFSASAMTGVIVFRCLASSLLPLGTARIVGVLGYGWGFSVLGILSLGLALIPSLLLRYGDQWRQRSKYTADSPSIS